MPMTSVCKHNGHMFNSFDRAALSYTSREFGPVSQLSFTKKRNSKSLSSHPTMSCFGFLTNICLNFCQTQSMNTILSMFVLPWSIKCTNQDFLLVPKTGVAFWNLFSITELVIMGDERASDSIRYTVWRIFFHDQSSVPQRNMTKHFL